MKILHVYRPVVPATRAQSVQVVHTCHALAERGHEVTLLADRADLPAAIAAGLPGVDPCDPTSALAAYGLDLPPTFDLRICPTTWKPGASAWFRWNLSRWKGDIAYVRAKRYVERLPAELPFVIEAHEVDSAQAEEKGEDPGPDRALEAAVFSKARGVVANCEGTLSLLEELHALPMRRVVIHNATRADRVVARAPSEVPTVGYTGSPKAYKGLSTVMASMSMWPEGVILELCGGSPEGTLPPNVVSLPPIPYGALPARLAEYHALILPLDDNLFGRRLTSPLKAWDYLATGIPVAAADLPTIRHILPSASFYRPGDPADLARAVAAALRAPPPPRRLRTWAERAQEIEAFLRTCV